MSADPLSYVWSFDEYSIGILREGRGSLSNEQVDRHLQIERPASIDRDAWYRHAKNVCGILNVERGRRVMLIIENRERHEPSEIQHD